MSEATKNDKPTRRIITADLELQTLAEANNLLSALPADAAGRVLAWLNARYGYSVNLGELAGTPVDPLGGRP